MIDVHDVATRIIDASRSPVPGNIALQRAVRVTTEKLADCWDDCAAAVLAAERAARETFPPQGEPGTWAPLNPYRAAVDTDHANDLNDLRAPHVEEVDEPHPPMRRQFTVTIDDDELAAMQIIVATLDELDERTQRRVIRYLADRINHETGALS